MFWTPNHLLTYNCFLHFVIGARGIGKTYGCKKWAIDDWLKTEKDQFGWIRRYQTENKEKDDFWNDMIPRYPEHTFSTTNKNYWIDKEKAGYIFSLSTSKIKKSIPYPDVDKMIFDEFLIDRGTYHYLPDEVFHFLDLLETVVRLRNNVKVFLLSNAITITNPYFIYFNLETPTAKNRIFRRGNILVELAQGDNEFKEAKNNSDIGKLIKGTDYGRYAIDNEFLRDDSTFIKRKTPNSRFSFGFVYLSKIYGVWNDYKAGQITVSEDYNPESPLIYAITKEDHDPNSILIGQLSRAGLFRVFLDQYEQGNVCFETMNVKNVCYQVFRMFNMR